MQYHADALATSSAEVDVIAYASEGSDRAIPHVRLHRLRDLPGARSTHLSRPLFLLYALLRAIHQSGQLFYRLLVLPKLDVILVQNPPAMPTLLVALLAARLHSAKLIIDWHNFGYTMLGQRIGPNHPVVRLSRGYEFAIGRRADAHLCVSRAMQTELRERGVAATVLYDCPAERFTPTPVEAQRDLFHRLRVAGIIDVPFAAQHRPAIVVSATSWTADEDFDLLLDALRRCDERLCTTTARLMVLITGEGPLRARFDAAIARLTLRAIQIRTLWLSPDDYARLLGSADLGVSLHRSSSGVDLPMKIADMFGAGLPVCAFDYGPCVTEQVQDGETGLLFSSSAQLAQQLFELFSEHPRHTPRLDRLRQNVRAIPPRRWIDAWTVAAKPLFFDAE